VLRVPASEPPQSAPVPAASGGCETESAPAPLESAPAGLDGNQTSTLEVENSFTELIAKMQQVLLDRGATRAAAVIEKWLASGKLELDALDSEAGGELVRRGFACIEDGELVTAPGFQGKLCAWCELLSGRTDDLSACGEETLDAWSARLLCAMMGAPVAHDESVRRALRQRGVVAFGVL
jgi:hypothetical protein